MFGMVPGAVQCNRVAAGVNVHQLQCIECVHGCVCECAGFSCVHQAEGKTRNKKNSRLKNLQCLSNACGLPESHAGARLQRIYYG